MAVRRILGDDDEILRSQAQPVKDVNKAVLRLLDDMVETMRDVGGIGLAGPQVGIARQVIVVDAGEEEPLQLINPRCLSAQGEAFGVEGCLSIPGVFGEVPRAERVVVTALDRAGREVRLEAEGLTARILQHEIDHLNGILFIDRATRLVDPDELKQEEA